MLTHGCSTHASFTPSPLPRPFMILCEAPRSVLAPSDSLGHQHFCAQCCQQDPQGQPQRRKRAQAGGSRPKSCSMAAQLSQSQFPGTALSSPQMHSMRVTQGPFQLLLLFF